MLLLLALYGAWRVFDATVVPLQMPCIFHTVTGYYCPGCGATRALIALLDGHLVESVKYNPIILLAALVWLAWFLEELLRLAGRAKKIIPRSGGFWIAVLGMFFCYGVLRNVITPWSAIL